MKKYLARISLIHLTILLLNCSGCVLFLPMVDTDKAAREAEANSFRGNATTEYNRDPSCSHCGKADETARPSIALRTKRKKWDRVDLLVYRYEKELNSSKAATRTTAVTSLGAIGVRAERAVPKIQVALQDESKWVRRAAVKALARIQGAKAAPKIRPLTRDPDPWVRYSAEKVLAAM